MLQPEAIKWEVYEGFPVLFVEIQNHETKQSLTGVSGVRANHYETYVTIMNNQHAH